MTRPTQQGLNSEQIGQFENDGYLIVRDVLTDKAVGPLIRELEQEIDALVSKAVDQDLLDPKNTFDNAPFDQRLACLSDACSDRNWFWLNFRRAGKYKSPGMFRFRTDSNLLDIVQSLIGPEILAHPQFSLRAKLPDHGLTEVPWHQDLGYLDTDTAGDTLIINAWVPLVKATAKNGCLQVLAGSHRSGEIAHHRLTTEPDHTAPVGIGDKDLPDGEIITCEVDVGDVLLTMERVVHRSLANDSDTVRWSVDSRYCCIDLPTGRVEVPGFIARSLIHAPRVAQSYADWIKLFDDANVDRSR